MVPESVIIIGGSVAGLLQGLQLKRQGSNVIVLEQDPSKDRHSHESGVSIGPSVVALLDQYDATGRPAAIPTEYLSAASSWRRHHLRVANTRWRHHMSNWGCLYLILRANFDGLASAAVPHPPAPKPGDGTVDYRPGKQVTGVRYDRTADAGKGRVYVEYVDVTSGATETASAGMVLAADGVHSTVRRLLQVPTRTEYAGYIGWRGTVPEELLSAKTVEYFENRLNFTLLRGTYFISYFIPTETGHIDPGKRLLNWVWYYFLPEGSSEMAKVFTDIHGKVHPNTVPQGLVNPEVWRAQLVAHLPKMTAPLAEVVSLTPRVFVTKVGEAQCSTSSFFDDRLVLVGDAFTGFRSHLGKASEQAAQHALQMDRVWRGEITQRERDREAKFYAERLILLNRLIGFMGLGLWWTVLKTGFAYLAVVVGYKLGFA